MAFNLLTVFTFVDSESVLESQDVHSGLHFITDAITSLHSV